MRSRWNPAELLIAALSACHQLWYLHLCADAGIVVVGYSDDASGVEIEQADGAGQFESVTLRPHATLTSASSDENSARRLHDAAAREMLYRALGVVQSRARTDVRDCVGVGEPASRPSPMSAEAKNRADRLLLALIVGFSGSPFSVAIRGITDIGWPAAGW